MEPAQRDRWSIMMTADWYHQQASEPSKVTNIAVNKPAIKKPVSAVGTSTPERE
jgi:hypothetical protein